MSNRKNEVIVGLVIVIAISISIIGYVYLREIPVYKQGYHVHIVFNNVSGLETGDAVTTSGMKVGRVNQMTLDSGKVSVLVWIKSTVSFPLDSRANIRSLGMIGEKFIEIVPGTATVSLKGGDTIIGSYVNDLADMGGSLSELLNRATLLLTRINNTLEPKFLQSVQNDVALSLRNTRIISSRLNQNLEQTIAHMETTLANLDSLSSSWATFWPQKQMLVDSTMTNVALSAAQLPGIFSRLDSALVVTQQLLSEVNSDNSALGKAIRDDELYRKTDQAINELNALVQDLKKNPQKYLKISMIDLF